MKVLLTAINICVFNLLLVFGQSPQPAPNVTDAQGLKQGLWTVTAGEKNTPGYAADQIIEEGFYSDNRKDGIWKKYYSNGKLEHQLTFKQDKLEGKAVFYYKSGKVKEEGIWMKNRWVGEYKYYYKNGNLRNEWKYNETGKRTGVQRYYYENGKVKIEGAWENGKESGAIVEFYEDGSVKSERFFAGGKLDPVKTKSYDQTAKTTATVKVVEQTDSVKQATKVKEQIEKCKAPFDGNGYHEFVDKEGRIIKKGNFVNGYLRNGETFDYTDEGKLKTTSYYRNGKKIREIQH